MINEYSVVFRDIFGKLTNDKKDGTPMAQNTTPKKTNTSSQKKKL